MDALSYPIPEPDAIVICPYNSSHAIEVKRMPYHLMKCRRQHAGREFATCPFNAKHEMPKPELRYHLANCPDRNRIAADLMYEESKNNRDNYVFKGCTDVPSYEYDFEMPKPSEDWDAETLEFPRIGIQPSVLTNPNIIRSTVGLTRSEKKEYNQYLFQVENGELPEELPVTQPQGITDNRLRTPQARPAFQQNRAYAGVGRGGMPAHKGTADNSHRPGMHVEGSAAALVIALARGKSQPPAGLQAPILGYLGGTCSSTPSSSTESQDDGSGMENGSSVGDLKKRQKKLQKKLRQIQALEDKQDDGVELSQDEVEKVSKREEIEKLLEVLNLD